MLWRCIIYNRPADQIACTWSFSGGDGKTLSLYCCRTGGVRSRGELGFDPKATIIATPNTNCHMLLLATTKRIVACQPCA